MESIDISLDNLEPISLDLGSNSGPSSVNFGSGIELLMNDKKRSASSDNTKLDLGDLDDLENEMNELSNNATRAAASQNASSGGSTKTLSGMAANLFGLGGFMDNSTPADEPPESANTDANLGHATRESAGNTKTWDGYSKMNDVPASGPASSSSSSNLNEREKRRKKRLMLKKWMNGMRKVN